MSAASKLVWGLSITQTIAWASSYYLLAIIAGPMARDLGVSTSTIFLALSAAILITGAVGPLAGYLIDKTGGRTVLAASNIFFAGGLAILANADQIALVFVGWLVIGLGMGLGLYEAAFACIARFHGANSRRMITTITLLGGLASTIGWPLTAIFETWWGWRGACLAWAAIHICLTLPLNLVSIPRLGPPEAKAADASSGGQAKPVAKLPMALVAAFLCLQWFISAGIAVHLPRILEFQGLSSSAAIAAAALLGPAQVVARLVEFGALQRLHPTVMSMIAAVAHPLGSALLLGFGAPAAWLFAIVHGAGNGLFTIARGTLTLALFGPEKYGYRLNLLMIPARIAQASAPFVFGLAVDHFHQQALVFTAMAGAAATLIAALLARGLFARAHQTSS